MTTKETLQCLVGKPVEVYQIPDCCNDYEIFHYGILDQSVIGRHFLTNSGGRFYNVLHVKDIKNIVLPQDPTDPAEIYIK